MPTIAPWTLRAWPPLLWQATRTSQLHFVHLDTRVLSAAESSGPIGQTLWIGPAADGEAGVAWDWVLMGRGVVAMADPMSVITNLRLVSPAGRVLTAFEAALHLNSLVHDLPWQHEVCRLLDEVKVPGLSVERLADTASAPLQIQRSAAC
jgi:hypothetical protein